MPEFEIPGRSVVIPINVDFNATRNDYKNLREDQLLATSMFYTFQGEGPHAGKPALFVRLAGCNIGLKQDCPWCDTRFNVDEGKVMDDVSLRFQFMDKLPGLIVVTGGEPLLQFDNLMRVRARFTAWFLENRGAPAPDWQLETNGLLLREEMVNRWCGVDFVISPKIPHNRNSYTPLKPWMLQGTNTFLKYVVTADEASPYNVLPDDVTGTPLSWEERAKVYVSGMTVYKRAAHPGEVASIWDASLIDQKATAENYKHAAKLALQHGFNVSYQTHLFGVRE